MVLQWLLLPTSGAENTTRRDSQFQLTKLIYLFISVFPARKILPQFIDHRPSTAAVYLSQQQQHKKRVAAAQQQVNKTKFCMQKNSVSLRVIDTLRSCCQQAPHFYLEATRYSVEKKKNVLTTSIREHDHYNDQKEDQAQMMILMDDQPRGVNVRSKKNLWSCIINQWNHQASG